MKNLILTIMTAALCCCTGTGDDSEFVKTDLMEEGLKGPVKEMRRSNRASQTCYKFNEAGFLTEKFDLITKSHERDASERPKESRKYHPNGKLAEKIEYSAYPDDYKHYTYNENGDILSDLVVVNKKVSSKNEYRYEETGKSSYNMFKNNVLCEEVKYDGKRRPVKITTFDSGVKVKSSTTVYKYDGKGRIKEKSTTYYKDDKYVSIQLYEYTPDGKILKRTEKSKRHPSPKFDVQTYEYKYTGNDLEIKHSDYRPSEMGVSERSKKPVVETAVVKYDKYGNSLQDYSYEYDEYGNWTSRKNSNGITVRYFVYYSDNKSDGVQDHKDTF
jgi:antitoxin component YwqK of YwqJK toxin-antitoxin module